MNHNAGWALQRSMPGRRNGHRRAGDDLVSGGAGPVDVAGGGVQRVHLAVVAADVDGAGGHRRAEVDLASGGVGPADHLRQSCASTRSTIISTCGARLLDRAWPGSQAELIAE